MDRATVAEALEVFRNHTAVVMPVHIPEAVDRGSAAAILQDNVSAWCAHLGRPDSVVLSVDGTGCGDDVAAEVGRRTGARVVCHPENRGKFMAVRHGIEVMLEDGRYRVLASVDFDGDHFANEGLNFVRAALAARAAGRDRVLVLGRRISRHHPMGYLRGELEELVDRVLLETLQYDAVKSGRPMDTTFWATLDEVPDFHSGYKLFDRDTAEAVFGRDIDPAGCTDVCWSRHAVEAVMVVEALCSHAVLVEVNRSTINDQPISAFGLLKREQLMADKMIWPARRLGVPAAFMDRWIRNHASRLKLMTLAPQGPDEVSAIHKLVMEQLGRPELAETPPLSGPAFL